MRPLTRVLAAAAILQYQGFAAASGLGGHQCLGPDAGKATTVVTVPAGQSVSIFHYRSGPRSSVVELCVREPDREWKRIASHGVEGGKWSLLQSWIHPKTMQIKTSVYVNGELEALKSLSRARTAYGYSFAWSDGESDQNDRVVYCYGELAGCPTSGRGDYP